MDWRFDPNYFIPLVAAFIGWITNLIAVKMLFHPRRPIQIFGVVIQGVFPKRRDELAERVGQLVSTELFSISEVTNKLTAKVRAEHVVEQILRRVEELAADRLARSVPLVGPWLRPEKLRSLTRTFVPDLEALVNDLLKHLNQEIENELDIHRIVAERIAAFPTEKLEALAFTIMRREFKAIEIIGGVLGFLIGLIQLAIYLVSVHRP